MTRTVSILCLFLTLVAASAASKKQVLEWVEPETLPTRLPDTYLRVVMNFSGDCPNCDKKIKFDVKRLHDEIEARMLPVRLVMITPDKTTSALSGYAGSVGLAEAVLAYDSANGLNISLCNIWQAWFERDGKRHGGIGYAVSITELESAIAKSGATHRFPVSGLEDDKARQLWWMVERGKPKVLDYLVKAAKKSAIADQAQMILDVVDAHYRAQADELLAADAHITTVDGLEKLLTEAAALDYKDCKDRLKELMRDRSLKDEFTARKAYRKIETSLVQHAAAHKRAQAAGAFAKLAEKLPDTHYGQLAAEAAKQ
jgi:hypothetical protein